MFNRLRKAAIRCVRATRTRIRKFAIWGRRQIGRVLVAFVISLVAGYVRDLLPIDPAIHTVLEYLMHLHI